MAADMCRIQYVNENNNSKLAKKQDDMNETSMFDYQRWLG